MTIYGAPFFEAAFSFGKWEVILEYNSSACFTVTISASRHNIMIE